jgi:hypothetical protein
VELVRDLGYGELPIDDAFELVVDMAAEKAQAVIEADGVEKVLEMLQREYRG